VRRHPKIEVYCRCGAAWYGIYATNNAVIADHAKRCGPAVTPERYEQQYGHRIRRPKWWWYEGGRAGQVAGWGAPGSGRARQVAR